MIEFIKTLVKRFRCDHDYRLLSIEWDGVSYYKCDKCGNIHRVPLGGDGFGY